MKQNKYLIKPKNMKDTIKRNKKAQNALEFTIILLFIFLVLVIFLGYTGKKITDIHEKEQEKSAQDYASKINNELKILNRAEPGYERKLIIYNLDYKIDIIYSTNDNTPVFIKLTDIGTGTNRTYYFDLIGNYKLNTGNLIINKTEEYSPDFNHNVTILTFKKLYKRKITELEID